MIPASQLEIALAAQSNTIKWSGRVELYAYTGEGIAGLVYLAVGLRMYGLSKQSRQFSDRLLSASFLLWALCYAIYDISYLLFYRGGLLPAPIAFASLLSLHLGTAAFAVFTRVVFRSRERWAGWLAAGTIVCLIVGFAGSIWVGDMGGEAPLSNPWWWAVRVGGIAPSIWIGVEGLIQFSKARQRQRLGLCKPLVANRYLLWGVAGSLWTVLELIDTAQYMAYERTGQWSDTLSVMLGCHEFIPGVLIWLAFFPPTAYRRWIEGSASDDARVSD
jgi:hypothetical protein